jgi:hypothetical protein
MSTNWTYQPSGVGGSSVIHTWYFMSSGMITSMSGAFCMGSGTFRPGSVKAIDWGLVRFTMK